MKKLTLTLMLALAICVSIVGCAGGGGAGKAGPAVGGEATPEQELASLLKGQGDTYAAREAMVVSPLEEGAPEGTCKTLSYIRVSSDSDWETYCSVESDSLGLDYEVFEVPGRSISVTDGVAYEEKREDTPSDDLPIQWPGEKGKTSSVTRQEEGDLVHFHWEGEQPEGTAFALVTFDGPFSVDYWFDADGVLQRQVIEAEGRFAFGNLGQRVAFSCDTEFSFAQDFFFPSLPKDTAVLSEGELDDFANELENAIASVGDNVTIDTTTTVTLSEAEDGGVVDAATTLYLDGEDWGLVFSCPVAGIDELVLLSHQGESYAQLNGQDVPTDKVKDMVQGPHEDSECNVAIVRAASGISKHVFPDGPVIYDLVLDPEKVPESVKASTFASLDEGAATITLDAEGRLESCWFLLNGTAADEQGGGPASAESLAMYSSYGTTTLD